MNKEDILFNGRLYTVYNPGEILRSSNGKVIDQLRDGSTIIQTRNIFQYIRKNYDLSPEEYTVLVMFRGNWNLIPKCECGCGSPVKIRGIGYFSKCVSQSHANRVTSLRKSELGTNPFSGERGSILSHSVNMNRVKNGTHHFQGKTGSERAKKKNSELSKKGLHSWQKLESKLKATRNRFRNSGNKDDICELYVASISGRDDIFKLGISVNSNGRLVLSQSNFSKMEYTDIKVLISSDRYTISDIEYDTKLKFNKSSVIGTETFPIEMKDEIVNYIKNLYNSYL